MNLPVAVISLNQTPLDWAGNESRIRRALQEARLQGAILACLPELCISGYGAEDAFFMPDTWHQSWKTLLRLLPETQGMIVTLGLPVFHQHSLFNSIALAVDGKLLGIIAKQHLAGDGVHYEPRWFKPWPVGIRDQYLTPDHSTLPIGDLIFDIGGIRIGFEICEDAWVADRPGILLSKRAVDLILNPSASHFTFGKAQVRRRFVAEGSRAFGAAYLYSNLLGNEAGRVLYDGQLLIAQNGQILAEGTRFSFSDHRILTANLDPLLGRIAKIRNANHQPMLPTTADPGLIPCHFEWPNQRVTQSNSPQPSPEFEHPLEEFTRAVTLGLFDYLRKSHSDRFVVSLSGGSDSAAVACLVRLMFEFAKFELGPDFQGKLSTDHFANLLITAYQSTEHSSNTTRQAARELAKALGATHHELNLAYIHQSYLSLIGTTLQRELHWDTDDIALQNIQARSRSPGIWMIANLMNALLLSTSNRSEAAVGYATMDGDTSGGLAPLSGISKSFLRQWLHWAEHTGPRIGDQPFPIPALAAVNRQQPTAELRPMSQVQTDEKDLMPYDILDFIEESAIRDRKSAHEIMELLQLNFPYPPQQMQQWTIRFFQLWNRNQWKRERYAPGFHLDDESLDPKTWCRWPILNGGFQPSLIPS